MKFILASLFVVISFQNILGYFSNIHHYNVNVCLLMKKSREPFQTKTYKTYYEGDINSIKQLQSLIAQIS